MFSVSIYCILFAILFAILLQFIAFETTFLFKNFDKIIIRQIDKSVQNRPYDIMVLTFGPSCKTEILEPCCLCFFIDFLYLPHPRILNPNSFNHRRKKLSLHDFIRSILIKVYSKLIFMFRSHFNAYHLVM